MPALTRPRRRLLVLTAVIATAVVAPQTATAQHLSPALTQFLREGIGLEPAQIRSIEQGEAVVRTLETTNDRDVAIVGIVKVLEPREAIVRRSREFTVSLAAPARTAFGIFNNPAGAADVRALMIDKDDADEARKCKPGDCIFKLPATEMQRMLSSIDWKARDVPERLSAYARERILTLVTNYRARGDSALLVYDDRGGVSASSAFRELMGESPYVFRYAPALVEYLRTYPRRELQGIDEVIFWATDDLPRLRPTLTVNHLVMLTPTEFPDMTLFARKQIYANHYFEAVFDLEAVIEADSVGGAKSDASYLVRLRRARFDNLPSGGLLNIRKRVLGSLSDRMNDDLRREQSVVKVRK